MAKTKSRQGRSGTQNKWSEQVNRLEAKLSKKKIELLKIKALHRKIAGEFIELWVETRRLKRKA
ncbi:MAG: hypothetical protein L6Q51_09395 [Cyclobacteriaceae bacterium]|nr:hypothetical protein [Cyclobacteriaceae bacterium]QOI96026.1 MAG: hypothetical protein HRU69_00400 [Flammeovirgaceae bacterium]